MLVPVTITQPDTEALNCGEEVSGAICVKFSPEMILTLCYIHDQVSLLERNECVHLAFLAEFPKQSPACTCFFCIQFADGKSSPSEGHGPNTLGSSPPSHCLDVYYFPETSTSCCTHIFEGKGAATSEGCWKLSSSLLPHLLWQMGFVLCCWFFHLL